MNSLFLLILSGYLMVVIQSRPSQLEDNNNQEDTEYEGDESPVGYTLEGSLFEDQDLSGQEIEQSQRLLDAHRSSYMNKNLAEAPVTQANIESSNYKSISNREVRDDNPETVNTNDNPQNGISKRHLFSNNKEHNKPHEQSGVDHHLINNGVNDLKNNQMHNNMMFEAPPNKRTVDSKTASAEEGEILFGDNRNEIGKVTSDDQLLDVDQSQTKQKSNVFQPESAFNNDKYQDFSRDRREASVSNQGEPNSNAETGIESEKSDNESEEMAIRKHIKKMSSDELEQLLNSLSEEKRALLKKIIDNVDIPDRSYDTLIKREITKKAGAAEDNSDDNAQSDGWLSTSFPKKSESMKTKQLERPSMKASAQELGMKNGANFQRDNENNPEQLSNTLSTTALNANIIEKEVELSPSEPVPLKNEHKRETNIENMAANESLEDPKSTEIDSKRESGGDAGFVSQDESNIDEIEQQFNAYDNSKISKRDIGKVSETDAQIKSLEESFPNIDAYDESAPYGGGPLIRVKRKDAEQHMKKRSAALLTDVKVGFFPYKAENEDEDTDEGNEFDDDGFYDPSPNFVSHWNKNIDSNSQQSSTGEGTAKSDTVDQPKSPLKVQNDGTISLGSDTDNVLSGVEGVDENIMFSSGMRNRRKSEENVENENNFIQSAQNMKLDDEIKTTAKSNIDVANYQENDSFGGLVQNYEGDLGRYKRIRRLKQSQNTKDNSN